MSDNIVILAALNNASLSGNENTRIRGTIIAIWALVIIIVCLRFLARRLSKAGLWYDDWLVVAATVSTPYKVIHGDYFSNHGNC